MKLFVSTCLALILFQSSAQKGLSWVSTGAGDLYQQIGLEIDAGYSIVTDEDHIYLTGVTTGNSSKFSDQTLNNGHLSFLAKYKKLSGELVWVKQLPGFGKSKAAINSTSEVFVVSFAFAEDSYLTKYASDGSVIWQNKILENATTPEVHSIAIDGNDDVYVGGKYSGGMFIVGDSSANVTSGLKAFLIKYTSSGDFKWFRSTEGGAISSLHGIAIDKQGNVIITGHFRTDNDSFSPERRTLAMGNFSLTSNQDLSNSYAFSDDIFVSKLSSSGQFLWAHRFGGPGKERVNTIEINSQNEIHVAGHFTDSISLGGTIYEGQGMEDGFLIQLDPNGEFNWINSFGFTLGGGIAVASESGLGVDIDNNDDVFLVGNFEVTAVFETDTVFNEGIASNVGFLAQYSKSGIYSWVEIISSSPSKIVDVKVENENIFLTGSFKDESRFLGTTLPETIPNTPNFFLARVVPKKVLNTESLVSSYHIYPNPTSGHFNVNGFKDQDASIRVFDINGKAIIQSGNQEINSEIDLSGQSTGIYFVRIETKNGIEFKKVIKH